MSFLGDFLIFRWLNFKCYIRLSVILAPLWPGLFRKLGQAAQSAAEIALNYAARRPFETTHKTLIVTRS